jgi:hypothetical protein
MLAVFLDHPPIFVAGEIAFCLSLVLFIGALIAAIARRASEVSQLREAGDPNAPIVRKSLAETVYARPNVPRPATTMRPVVRPGTVVRPGSRSALRQGSANFLGARNDGRAVMSFLRLPWDAGFLTRDSGANVMRVSCLFHKGNDSYFSAFFRTSANLGSSLMRLTVLALAGATILVAPMLAVADDNGALTGAAGGAVTGAIVGGPVGAAVGGVAGAVVGGSATGQPRPVVVEPAQPCATRTTTTTNNNTGSSRTTQTTDCPD